MIRTNHSNHDMDCPARVPGGDGTRHGAPGTAAPGRGRGLGRSSEVEAPGPAGRTIVEVNEYLYLTRSLQSGPSQPGAVELR